MGSTTELPRQTVGKKLFQKATQAAVQVMLRPQIFWSDPSLKETLKHQPAIFLCNHTDHYDGIFAGAVLERYQAYALVKRNWYDKPMEGKLIQMSRSIPIDTEGMDASWFMAAEQLLKDGKSMLIFPEGSIARNGKMLPFQPGAALLASKTGVPLIPMAIYGEYSFNPAVRQKLYIGKPIYGKCPDDMRPSKYARQLTVQIEDQIHRLYGALEKKYGRNSVYYDEVYAPDMNL